MGTWASRDSNCNVGLGDRVLGPDALDRVKAQDPKP